MKILKGISVSPGYAIAQVLLLEHGNATITRKYIKASQVASHVAAFEDAIEQARKECSSHLARLSKKIDKTVLKIIESYQSMFDDMSFKKDVTDAVRKNRYSTEYAVTWVIRKKVKALSSWGTNSFTERIIQDFSDLERTLLGKLLRDSAEDLSSLKDNVILVARELTPAQTASLDKEKVKGILTDKGGKTSHSAIIASSLGIPAIVGLENVTKEVAGGDTVILDGQAGTVIIDPDEETIKRYGAMEMTFSSMEKRLVHELKDLPSVTRDGVKITILANIESPDEVQSVLDYGGDGIGLYRTEFLYLTSKREPTEKDHIEAYSKAIKTLGNRKIVIRTLDIGADKFPVPGIDAQPNPLMGVRAIRLSMEQMEQFTTQLRAVLKVSEIGNVSLMFPMVSSLHEIIRIREILDSVKMDLAREKMEPRGKLEVGIMVEVPSCALVTDQMCDYVDFFSIGTNDLIAFLMAVDRGNEKVSQLYQPSHPAVIRLLKQIVETALKLGKGVSICGEMSSDPLFTQLLIGMGLRILSVVPPAIPEIKRVIRSVTIHEAQEIAREVMKFKTAKDVLEFLKGHTPL